MKKLILVMVLFVALVGCTTDKTPIASIEIVQPEWRALLIRNVQVEGDFVIVQVWDRIENEFLKQIRCVDPNSGEVFEPVDWEYYYSQKDAHVYLVTLTLEDWQRQPRFEGR